MSGEEAKPSPQAGRAPGNGAPAVTIVVPARDEEASLFACLESIRAQDYPAGRLRILVVDGGSGDRTRSIAEEFARRDSRIELLDNPAGRVSTALNLALSRATGDFLLRVDAHTRIAPDYVRRCVDRLRTSGADNVGGPMRPVGSTPLGEAIATAMRSRFGVGPARFRYAREVEEVDTVYLGAFPLALFARVGRFNEALVRNQDYEMNYRIRRSGGRVLVDPEIRSDYVVRPDLPALLRQFASYGYWKPQMLRRHPRSLRPRQLAAPGLVAGLAVALVTSVAALLDPELPRPLLAAAPLLVALYLAASLLAAAISGARRGWRIVWRLPAVFATMHLAWGAGFWWGLIRPPRDEAQASASRAGTPR